MSSLKSTNYDVLKQYLEHLSSKKSSLTIKSYNVEILKFYSFLSEYKLSNDILKITSVNISKNYLLFLEESGYKIATIKRKLSILRKYFNYLIELKLIYVNVFDYDFIFKENLPKKTSKIITNLITPDTDYENSLSVKNHLILTFLTKYGLSVLNVIDLQLNQIDYQNKILNLNERLIHLDDVDFEDLKYYLIVSRNKLLSNSNELSDFVFINKYCKKFSVRGIRLLISNMFKNAGVSVNPTILKHTFIENELSKFKNIDELSKLLGYSSNSSLEYIKKDENEDYIDDYNKIFNKKL